MSRIILTISNKTPPSGEPTIRASFKVKFNYGSGDEFLTLNLTTTSGVGRFIWSPDLNLSANNYAVAFNRDFKNVGGSNNLTATVISTSQIAIESVTGVFISAETESNIAGLAYQIDSTVPVVDELVLNITRQSTGDCTNIDYVATASGGTQPYTLLVSGGASLSSNWDGSSLSFSLSRGNLHAIKATDATGTQKTETANVPRKLYASEFSVAQTQVIGAADLSITNTNPVAGTTPISYSLNGTDYQVDTNFAGIPEGDYTLYIKDSYGCVVTKTIVVISFVDPTVEVQYNHLYVSNFNSISYSPCTSYDKDNKKNYENTLSFSEYVKVPYHAVHKFTLGDIDDFGVGTQFQSSYPYHIITLHNEDGSKIDIAPIKIQQNLGSTERVDCKLIPVDGGIGVYFDGGNEYTADTTTVIGASEHTKYLPDWAELGQYVGIVSLGYKEIIGFGYDSVLDRDYFIVSGVLSAAKDDIVQVKYDVNPYNLFEFYINPSVINKKGVISIEAGYSYDKISKRMISEAVELIEDSDNLLLIEWNGYKNIGDMVFVSGIKGVMRIEGKMRPYAKSEAELADTDVGSFSLRQKSTMGQRVVIPMATPKIWDKLNDVSGISIGGTLKVNGLELVRNKEIEVEEKGDSNISSVTLEFNYGGNSLAIQSDEVVLNVSTGVVGGGAGVDDDIIIPSPDGKTRLTDDSGNFITIGRFYIEVE